MTLISHLNTLESSGLIRLIAAQPELEYLFRHALVQDAAYGSLLKKDRKRLHLAVGEALEQLYPNQRHELAATLAHHFEKAEVREKAIHYFTLAGDRARQAYASAEAIAFFRAAISQIEHVMSQATEQLESWREKLAKLFESLADVVELTGQHHIAQNAYGKALKAQGQLAQPDPVGQARLSRKLGFACSVNRQHTEAQQAWDEGEKMLGSHPSEQDASEQAQAWRREWIEIQVERAWNHYWRFQTDEMERVCEKARPVMERYGTPVQRARVLMVICLARFQRERALPSDETMALTQEVLTYALASGDLALIFDAQFNVGFFHLYRLEFDQVDEPFRACMEIVERTGDAIRKSRCVTYLMMLARMRGQVAKARSYIPQVLDLAWAGKMTNYTYTGKACLAWAAWREGDLAEAREQARASLELLQGPLVNYMTKWPALWPLLAVAFAEQNTSEAIEYARALLHPTQNRFPGMLTIVLEEAVAASEQNRMEDACTHLNRALELAQEMGYL
jgi:hypothetical protein